MQKLHHSFKQRARHKPRHTARRHARRAIMTLAVLSFGAVGVTRAQTTAPQRPIGSTTQSGTETREARAERWKESFDLFAAADLKQAPKPGGVLFVGSSSIRLWDSLEQDFQALPIVTKRGFGGSRLSDCSEHVSKLVLPYKPRLVIVYAGDNDLAEGATPADVLTSFKRFVEAVHRELPETRIAYLSIKPSPLRAQLIAQAQRHQRADPGLQRAPCRTSTTSTSTARWSTPTAGRGPSCSGPTCCTSTGRAMRSGGGRFRRIWGRSPILRVRWHRPRRSLLPACRAPLLEASISRPPPCGRPAR